MRPLVSALILLLAASSFATAQRTWIVDAARGKNFDYTDLPPAVAAARPGDRIVVRAGFYDMFEVTKGLAILAEPGVRLGSGPRSDILIHKLPAGSTFSLHGVEEISSYRLFVIRVENCSGTVILEGSGNGIRRSLLGPIAVQSSADVRIVNAYVGQMHFTRSTVSLERCELGKIQFGGIVATDSLVNTSRSTIWGSSHTYSFAGPAVRLNRARLVATASEFFAGTSGVGPAVPLDGVSGTGVVEHDARTTFSPSFGGRPLGKGVTAQQVERPILTARGAPANSLVHVSIQGQPRYRFALFAGLPTVPVAVPGLPGEIGLAPVIPVWSGQLDAAGDFAMILRVPGPASLDVRGQAITWQALTYAQGRPAGFLLSTPSTYVHGLR